MYNGRQNIQTESIHDQLVQKNPYVDTKWRKKCSSRRKIPAMREENTWQKEKYTRSLKAHLTRK